MTEPSPFCIMVGELSGPRQDLRETPPRHISIRYPQHVRTTLLLLPRYDHDLSLAYKPTILSRSENPLSFLQSVLLALFPHFLREERRWRTLVLSLSFSLYPVTKSN